MSKREQFKWVEIPNSPGAYIQIEGHRDALVRTKPTHNGRYLWQAGKVYDWSPSVEEAKEMVEGLVLQWDN